MGLWLRISTGRFGSLSGRRFHSDTSQRILLCLGLYGLDWSHSFFSVAKGNPASPLASEPNDAGSFRCAFLGRDDDLRNVLSFGRNTLRRRPFLSDFRLACEPTSARTRVSTRRR